MHHLEVIIFNKLSIATPELETISYRDDPHVPRATDFNERRKPIVGIVCHTVKGAQGALNPGSKPSVRAEVYAKYQANTARDVSWDYTVDTDGTVIVSNDPVTRYTWQAGASVVNSQTLGIEAVQDSDGAQYVDEITAEVRLIEICCAALHIDRTTPVTANGEPFKGLLASRLFRGVYGHRNIWKLGADGVSHVAMRGAGDPGDHIFKALLVAGFKPVVVAPNGQILG